MWTHCRGLIIGEASRRTTSETFMAFVVVISGHCWAEPEPFSPFSSARNFCEHQISSLLCAKDYASMLIIVVCSTFVETVLRLLLSSKGLSWIEDLYYLGKSLISQHHPLLCNALPFSCFLSCTWYRTL